MSKELAATALDCSEWALLISGLILVIGIFGEYEKLPGRFLGRKALYEILVMIGVAGELLGDAGVFILSRDLQSANDREIALLYGQSAVLNDRVTSANLEAKRFESQIEEAKAQARASDARVAAAVAQVAIADARSREAGAKAESFRLNIAKANESAAKAQAQVASATAEAEKANLELAKLKRPRTLTKEQQHRIADKIALYPGTPFYLWVSTDSDSTSLMNWIDDAIRAAGWQFKPPNLIAFAEKAGIIAASGVSIHFAQEQRGKLERAALVLGAALSAEGIPTIVYSDLPEANKDKDKTAIHVMIGSKPLN